MLDLNPSCNPKLSQMIGVQNIVRLQEKINESKDVWFSYNLGKKPLSEYMFQLKQLIFKGEQICSV